MRPSTFWRKLVLFISRHIIVFFKAILTACASADSVPATAEAAAYADHYNEYQSNEAAHGETDNDPCNWFALAGLAVMLEEEVTGNANRIFPIIHET
mmetsp:Transcript_25915/g.36120  ORF Transcript_25915/g.36120 Transcript_25915/m.36120 type:complete len:97 (+) Transcript_25915:774-1064(+)|eukprot:CAMPEP_0184489306 /NCGR_PEP_ID=MMETSP0113_2-20130426/15012_1 /TAXON_ID=91329 /ORGANISM="Norrisiella sphaerica, Strain BC52" /LENGTH=96 /DNA_ID=CAMNT_0026872639 /DNA_START=768 /DNA_END=1058 /DNA_ORIENTATION=+